MPSTPDDNASKSGITTSASGERHIPASTRADGSVRKEIKVRPGYRPPEDVEVYKNRTAQAWKNRGKGGVPGADFADSPDPKPPTKNAKKKAEKKENGVDSKTHGTKGENLSKEENAPPPAPVDPEAEKEKEARKLSKKLRQARDLQQKKEKGDSLLPEQFEKVIKINELIRQLDNMGFDADGERKQP